MSNIVFQLASIEVYVCGLLLAIAGVCGLTLCLLLQRGLTKGYRWPHLQLFLSLAIVGSFLVSVQLLCQELTCTQFAISAPTKVAQSHKINTHQYLTRK